MTPPAAVALPKVATHIDGLDAVLRGGLPAGRTTLVWGGPGSGKSVLSLECLYRGALAGEPGLFVAFEEPAAAVRQNALTLGWDVPALEAAGRLAVLDGTLDPAPVLSGDFDPTALLAILEGEARRLGARRVVLDAVDVLLRLYPDPARAQAEFYGLVRWLGARQLTALVTLKAGEADGVFADYAFLDFLADCVLRLDRRSLAQVSTRRLQVLKYRGSSFGGNEYPYIIADDGVHLLPISSVALVQQPLGDLVSSGHGGLDALLGGGYRRGSCLLITGNAGTGKTTLASLVAQAAAARGEPVLFISFEESEAVAISNMLGPGVDLRPARQAGRLRFLTQMPEAMGAEEHLFRALRALEADPPGLVVVDALASAQRMGSPQAAFEYVLRLLTACKARGITCVFTNDGLHVAGDLGLGDPSLASMADVLIALRLVTRGGAGHRLLRVVKARRQPHSPDVHAFRLTAQGLVLLGPWGSAAGAVPPRAPAPEDT
jgi:circadian clock protein KaiC